MSGRGREITLALTVGVVLADSSIVTLALPEILRIYDTSVFGVSWVLTAFNLVLALCVLPAAARARRRPRGIWLAGLLVFSVASLLCAIAPSIAVLVAARCLQAVGGAAVIAGAIELLASARGSHQAAAGLWGAAGTAGLAIGPALGGALTELLSWQSIFLLQVPILAAALAVSRRPASPLPERGRPGEPIAPAPEIALGLLSAALTGALFLLVILLTEGWGLGPLSAALVITALPAASLAARAAKPARQAALALGGAILISGGLAALGLLPSAEPLITVPPQLLIGAGLALALPVLTSEALARRDPQGRRAAGTIAARHAGIVVGILVLTPLLSLELDAQHDAAASAGTALLLDAPLSPDTKVELGAAIGDRIEISDGRLPDLSLAFDQVEPIPAEATRYAELEQGMVAEVEKAATHAFSLPFLGAAGFALLSLAAIAAIGRRP